jgi:hypothetical protein
MVDALIRPDAIEGDRRGRPDRVVSRRGHRGGHRSSGRGERGEPIDRSELDPGRVMVSRAAVVLAAADGVRGEPGGVGGTAAALLAEGPKHGYQIIQEQGAQRRAWTPSPGSVYLDPPPPGRQRRGRGRGLRGRPEGFTLTSTGQLVVDRLDPRSLRRGGHGLHRATRPRSCAAWPCSSTAPSGRSPTYDPRSARAGCGHRGRSSSPPVRLDPTEEPTRSRPTCTPT